MLKGSIAGATLCALLSTTVHAAQPDTGSRNTTQPAFRVANVAQDDVLNVRNGPSSDHDIVGSLQPGATGIAITGDCRSTWCPIAHDAASGWVNRRFLVREASVHGPTGIESPEASATPAPGALGKQPAEAAFEYFLAQGWTEHQAAGIVGNLQVECGQLLNCSLASGGIAQWRGDRVTRFKTIFGYPFSRASFADQLAYIHWELTDPESPWKDSGRVLKDAVNETSAAALFDVHYERSAGTSRGQRIANARTILKRYGGRPNS